MTTTDHEVRLRLLEDKHAELKEVFIDIRGEFKEIRTEMKSQFRWTISLIFGFVGVVTLPVVASEIIGLIKLIHTL